jgi:hypothetical protein
MNQHGRKFTNDIDFATVLTIFFVPALYAAWFRVQHGGPATHHVPAHVVVES